MRANGIVIIIFLPISCAQRLQKQSPAQIVDLHRRAGDWYTQNGRFASAIRHYLQGNQYDQAADLILQVADTYLMHSEVDTLLFWIQALPHEVVGERPLLFVYQAGAYLLAGKPISTIEAHIQEAIDHSQGAASAEVHVLRGLLAIYQGDAEAGENLSQEALRLLPEENKFLRSLVVQNLALGQIFFGEIDGAINSLLAAAEMCAQAGNIMSQVICLAHVAECAILGGRLHQAEAYYQKAIAHAVDSQKRPLPIMGLAQIGLAEVYREWNLLEKAATLSTKGLAQVQRWGKLGELEGYIWASRLKQAQGDFVGASRAIAQATAIATRFDATFLDDYLVEIAQVQLDLRCGRTETAVRWLNTSPIPQKTKEQLPYHIWETVQLTKINIAIAQQDTQLALNLAAQILPSAKQMGRQGYVIDILTLQAVAHFQDNKQQQAINCLHEALNLAQPENYVRTFIDKGEAIQQLLTILHNNYHAEHELSAKPTKLHAYIIQLLNIFQSTLIKEPAFLLDPLSLREREVLHLIVDGVNNRDIAAQLGIAHSTVKTHINNIYSKLGVKNRRQAAARAQELELLA